MVIRACDALILKPKRLRSILGKQGIRGPLPSFLLGNIPDMQKIQNSSQPSDQSTPQGMTKLMVESVENTVVKPLISLIDGEGGVADVNVDEHMTNFARDVISRLCFGSNHSEGEGHFLKA
ncbi:hypothetical protein FEM48_Zijuj10G0041100 [Ziziphus jujuba var. spinosa]|uniref:Uncharacterized protein n=1 Tax=Ziziphus jujuba var. spinosa TaxID=714518 RepID=A0A978UL72_ZIZJJ|nr:hypothetical protein FEM48_Zijuj10G0041100 [Ziziphus jujuba var. spinosa]